MRQPTALAQLLSLTIAVAALAALPGQASAAIVGHNKINNGSFETGDFTGWTQFGNNGFTGVFCPGPGPGVTDGNCAAFFGPIGSTGGVMETFSTAIGATLHVSFDFLNDNGTPGSFAADFISAGDTTLVSLTNPPGGGSASYSFDVVATAATSTLKFSFQDDQGFMFLDNVAVVPEPTSLALVGLALAGLALGRKRKAI